MSAPKHYVICTSCGSKLGWPKKQLCRPCQMRIEGFVRRSPFTPEQDQLLRDAYAAGRAHLVIRRRQLMELTGYTLNQVSHRARMLGLKLFSQRPWSQQENQFLRDNAGEMTIQKIAKVLGRNQSAVSVHRSRLRIRGRFECEGYSGREFAEIMGVTSTTVYGWIRKGKLRTYADRISEKDARAFIANYPYLYNIRRVDDFGFKALLFGVADAVRESA